MYVEGNQIVNILNDRLREAVEVVRQEHCGLFVRGRTGDRLSERENRKPLKRVVQHLQLETPSQDIGHEPSASSGHNCGDVVHAAVKAQMLGVLAISIADHLRDGADNFECDTLLLETWQQGIQDQLEIPLLGHPFERAEKQQRSGTVLVDPALRDNLAKVDR